MTWQTGTQITAIHILLNIWKSESNETMKFGYFLEHDMLNIFPIESSTTYGGEASSIPFYKKNWAYLWINSLNCYKFCFCCMYKLRSTKMYWSYDDDHLLLSYIGPFQIKKEFCN